MTPKRALESIYALPRFNRGETLEPVKELLRALREPQKALRFLHVAGTNGKGSICTMCAAALEDAGLRVGLYTSPFIHDFRERFQINGKPVSPAEFASATQEVFSAIRRYSFQNLSQFDVVTAIGLLIFARAGCQIVVLECGLGGRLDATNVIAAPEVAVIGNIGFDHTELLGDTIEKITAEKCGIIKKGTGAVICAPQDYPTAVEVIKAKAEACGVPLVVVSQKNILPLHCGLGLLRFVYRNKEYESALAAIYQARNAATAIEALFALRKRQIAIPDKAIASGLRRAYIPARLELMSIAPHILLDGAHNVDGLRALRASIEAVSSSYARLFCLVGMLREKEPRRALSAFYSSSVIGKKLHHIATITPSTPRAYPAAELARLLDEMPEINCPVTAYDSPTKAIRACLAEMNEDDALLCFGSLYAMGDIRHAIEDYYNAKG